MGKGKGDIKDQFAFYPNGFIFIEIKGISIFESTILLNFLKNQNFFFSFFSNHI